MMTASVLPSSVPRRISAKSTTCLYPAVPQVPPARCPAGCWFRLLRALRSAGAPSAAMREKQSSKPRRLVRSRQPQRPSRV